MGKKSRDKGNRAEREVCSTLKEHLGGDWSRVPLSGGWGNRKTFDTCGDIITSRTDFPFTIEVKNQEGWHLEQLLTSPDKCMIRGFWHQACEEAKEAGKAPLLIFTRNFQPLFCLIRYDDLPWRDPDPEPLFELVIDSRRCCILLFDAMVSRLKESLGVEQETKDAGHKQSSDIGQRQ